MTSQKSLKNNVNLNDFKRSLGGSLLFPAIAFVVIFFCVTAGVIGNFYSEENKSMVDFDLVYIFFDTSSIFYSVFEVLQMGMVLCGMMTAAKSFYFLLSKKQVNVYLSLGVTRTKMFLNRLGAAAITLFTSVFIPFTISYLINIAKLDATTYLRDVYLYIVFSLFVASMVGFAIGSFAMMASGNIFESAITMGTISFLPTIIVNLFNISSEVMLKGYSYNAYYNYYNNIAIFLNPFTFINNSEQEKITRSFDDSGFVTVNQVVMNFRKSALVNNAIPKDYEIDWYFIRPVVIWLVVAVVLTALALFLFNKRKAEHSNSLGKFAVSRAINGAFAVCVACLFCVGVLWYEIGTIGVTLASIGLSFVAYFLVQLILTRKIKTALKSLSMCAVFMFVFVSMVGFIVTEYFGTFNKLPEKDNIKAISITVPVDFAYNYPALHNRYVISTNSDDISMAMSLFEEVKKDDGKYNLSISDATFEFETKDGEIITRDFGIYSPDLYNKYYETVVNSNFFDGVLEYEFLGFDENNKSKNGEYIYITSDRVASSDPNKVALVDYYDSQLIVPYEPAKKENDTSGIENEGDKGYIEYEEIDRQYEIYKGDDLAIALYNDLSKMTYSELFKNNSQPLSVLGWEEDYVCKASDIVTPTNATDDSYYYDSAVDDVAGIREVYAWLSIYPEMTETNAYFKDNHIEFAKTYNVPIKQVLYTDSKLTFTEAQRAFIEQVVEVKGETKHYKTYFSHRKLPIVSFSNTSALTNYSFYNLRWYIPEKITQEDLLKKVYTDIGHPLKVVEKDNINNVVSKSVGQYETHNDNGRVVYIIYEDGSMIAKYLPQANISVLK